MSILHSELLSQLNYDKSTGVFTWKKVHAGVSFGRNAGSNRGGYIVICINRKKYYAHRLAWFYVNGVWPNDIIDHIDLNKSNNSISNLRECTPSQNNANALARRGNSSGLKGVTWVKKDQKWAAQIVVNRKTIFLGGYDCKDKALEAYRKAAIKYYGEFANFG